MTLEITSCLCMRSLYPKSLLLLFFFSLHHEQIFVKESLCKMEGTDYSEQQNITGPHQSALTKQIKQCRQVCGQQLVVLMLPIRASQQGDALHIIPTAWNQAGTVTCAHRSLKHHIVQLLTSPCSPSSAQWRRGGEEKGTLISVGWEFGMPEVSAWMQSVSVHNMTCKLCLWPPSLCVTNHNKTWTTRGHFCSPQPKTAAPLLHPLHHSTALPSGCQELLNAASFHLNLANVYQIPTCQLLK